MTDHHEHGHPVNDHSVTEELMCHFPYAVLSVAFCLVVLSFITFATFGNTDLKMFKKGTKLLFHSFHFMHLVFAATGTLITYFRFSKNIIKGLIVGTCTAVLFCLISDAVLPYIGGRLLGVDMHFHVCFITDFHNVFPFLFIGLLSGLILSRHHWSHQKFYSLSSHFTHIFISSLASSFYLVSYGFFDWYKSIGYVFVFLIFAVVVPCTLSDVVVPMFFAKSDKK